MTKLTISTLAAVIVLTSASGAMAQSRQQQRAVTRPATTTATVNRPLTGAEWWQNKGISEEMVGIPYRGR